MNRRKFLSKFLKGLTVLPFVPLAFLKLKNSPVWGKGPAESLYDGDIQYGSIDHADYPYWQSDLTTTPPFSMERLRGLMQYPEPLNSFKEPGKIRIPLEYG